MTESTEDLAMTMRRASALVDGMLAERQDLLTAVSDLLHFQSDAMDVIASGAWPKSLEHAIARRVEGLVERQRRPTPAISKVRKQALAFTATDHVKQFDLPLNAR